MVADTTVPAGRVHDRAARGEGPARVLNAIRYMARPGGGWRMLPKDFPPWQTVYWWCRSFVRRFSSRQSTMWR